ncbi:Phospholipase A2 activator protein [Carabus blaptoides fortunei]
MSLEEFKLSTVLYGHSLDVRAVDVNYENCILSGSRDKTCKFWRPNGFNTGYTEALTLKGHKSYVSSVCCLPPSAEYLNGLLITGGNDNNICVYTPDNPEPCISLKGHTNTVCCITKANKSNTLLTSSWDCTAKLWLIRNSTLNEVSTFSGHQAAVWAAIQLPNHNVVTGSADKDIIIWSESGVKQKVLKGHTDCVRDLTMLNENFFISVANDASIKQWTLDGECLETYYGHGNYIYSVSTDRALGDNSFVTSGEDRVVKVWQNGNNTQTVTLPAQSVWSVACLTNGDIVTGSSDGVVRVFTRDPARIADEQQLKLFEEEVANLNVTSSQDLGGVKIADLPGQEVLYEPGKSDGQTKLVRQGTSVVCYSWSAEEGTWNKVGDVMGAAGGTQASSGKTLYEGKEYDFVFSVDIEDGKPPLKLPYNRDQDPWFAAQTFIHKNSLSQMFLDQVANFIIQNSGGAVVTQTSQTNDYVDPFTGESRYLPGSTVGSNGNNSGMNLDPFTGGSSYTTSSTAQTPSQPMATQNISTSSTNASTMSGPSYFPHMSYLFFDQGNVAVIHEKLKEFNEKTGDNIASMDENMLEGVVKLAGGSQADGVYTAALIQLLYWPKDILFPVLDITRLAVRHAENNIQLGSHSNSEFFIQLLRNCIVDNVPANKMLALRILCNMFSHTAGETFVTNHEQLITNDLATLGDNLNKNCQIALSTFLLNLTIALVKSHNTVRLLALFELVAQTILKLNDPEAEFRSFVALGTILSHVKTRAMKPTGNNIAQLKQKLNTVSNNNIRNKNCATQLNSLL